VVNDVVDGWGWVRVTADNWISDFLASKLGKSKLARAVADERHLAILIHPDTDAVHGIAGYRLIVNDLGWVYIGEQGRAGRGLHIPVTSRFAALAWIDPANPGKVDHQDMRPGTIRFLNAAVWEEAPESWSDTLMTRPTWRGCARRLTSPIGSPWVSAHTMAMKRSVPPYLPTCERRRILLSGPRLAPR
jgi:hypothetical protein